MIRWAPVVGAAHQLERALAGWRFERAAAAVVDVVTWRITAQGAAGGMAMSTCDVAAQ